MDAGGVRGVGCMRIRCSSPRRMMLRWLSSSRKVKAKTTVAESGRSEDHLSNIRCSENCDPELRKREVLFSMGMSCCLLHLIAAGKEELHKIAELRSEIEMLLENAKEERQRKQSDIYEYSTTDVLEGPESSTQLLSPTNVLQEGSLKHYVSKQQVLEGGMDQLEAELEAELELLQEKLKDGVNERQGVAREGYGVCPYELERRLHELLERRQEGKIRELEAALRSAKDELQEKEAEVCWWKDTAYVVSERIPESSRATFNLKFRGISETHPLSR